MIIQWFISTQTWVEGIWSDERLLAACWDCSVRIMFSSGGGSRDGLINLSRIRRDQSGRWEHLRSYLLHPELRHSLIVCRPREDNRKDLPTRSQCIRSASMYSALSPISGLPRPGKHRKRYIYSKLDLRLILSISIAQEEFKIQAHSSPLLVISIRKFCPISHSVVSRYLSLPLTCSSFQLGNSDHLLQWVQTSNIFISFEEAQSTACAR